MSWPLIARIASLAADGLRFVAVINARTTFSCNVNVKTVRRENVVSPCSLYSTAVKKITTPPPNMILRSNSHSDFRLQQCVVYNIIRLLRVIIKARLILG